MDGYDQISSTTSGTLAFVLTVLLIIGMWKIYTKAGRPGWASIVPLYNVWVLCEIAGKPGWWMFLLMIPLVNIAIWVIIAVALSEKFGHGLGFAMGLILLPSVFYIILGFGGSRYQGALAA